MTRVDSGGLHIAPEWVDAWTRGQGEARARQVFARLDAGEPDGTWSSPGRVTIIGEHTDYSKGLCLPTVTPHRTYIAARRRDDDIVRIVSAQSHQLSGPDGIWESRLDQLDASADAGWPAYPAGTLWALRERGFDGPGLDLAITSCVPTDVGLGSSAAVTTATALAANSLWSLALDGEEGKVELAEACLDAENAIAGTASGGLGPHSLLRCHEGEALELDFAQNPPEARQRPLYFPDYGLGLLVIDTRVPHSVPGGGFAAHRRACQDAARALGVDSLRDVADAADPLAELERLTDPLLRRRARHVVTEIERVREVATKLSGTGPASERFTAVGTALYRSHASLEVDYEVSGPELNLAVDAAYRAGALGARLIGGGFSGCAMALVRRPNAQTKAEAITQEFVRAGFERPRFLLV